LAGALLACVALIFAPPGEASFWPPCPIHQTFGIQCPGCGATRALAALMHGHLLQAMRLNALFVILLPFGLVGAVQTYRRAIGPSSFRWPHVSNAALCGAVIVSAVFTIARNVPR
jgi:cell shape-determining protein MreD